MEGYLVFNGGEAFSRQTRPSDRTWLNLLRREQRQNPRLAVLPTATIEKPQKAAHLATEYLNTLSAFAEYKLITNRQEATTAQNYEQLDKVEGIVLTDGSAFDLIERLAGTPTLAAIERAINERRAAVVGIGASAMALGAVYWFGSTWEPGFALAPHLAIMVQHNLVRMRLSPERLLADLPEGVTLIGIDQTAALIAFPDGTFQALGQGKITIYQSKEQQISYEAGQTFMLESP